MPSLMQLIQYEIKYQIKDLLHHDAKTLIKIKNDTKSNLHTYRENKKDKNNFTQTTNIYNNKMNEIKTQMSYFQNKINELTNTCLTIRYKIEKLHEENNCLFDEIIKHSIYELEKNKYFINIQTFKYVYKSNSDDVCGICYDDLVNTTTVSCFKCKKQIHKTCAETWMTTIRNRTCIYCTNNCWNKYIIDTNDEIALIDEQPLNKKDITQSEEYIIFKNKYDDCKTQYEKESQIKISKGYSNVKKINTHNEEIKKLLDKMKIYEKIIESFERFKICLEIMIAEIKNMLEQISSIRRTKKYLKNIRIVLNNIHDHTLDSQIVPQKFIKKYKNNFRSHKHVISNNKAKNNDDLCVSTNNFILTLKNA